MIMNDTKKTVPICRNTKVKYYLGRTMSVLAAIVLIQTLYFKFTKAPESVYIFSQLGMEPYGRLGTGIIELVIALLLLYRATSLIGAILAIGIISAALFSHLFVLGIEVQNDGGLLFGLAMLVFVSSSASVFIQRDKLIGMIKTKRILIH